MVHLTLTLSMGLTFTQSTHNHIAWQGYRDFAWGFDELKPISKAPEKNWFGLALTAIDALDTSLLMGVAEITSQVRDWLQQGNPVYAHDGLSNVFEVTIRVLGGFLSAHHLTGDPLYLDKAVELADILMPVFATSSKIPATSINFKTRTPVPEIVASTSEATTLQLEFKYLTYLTGNVSYWNAAQEIFQVLLREPRPEGLVPIYIDQSTGTFTGTNIRLGSRGDSYYEYLAKQWLQTGETEKTYKKEWETAVLGIRKHLLGISSPNGLLYVGERANGLQGPLSPKMDHLVCFLPGTLAIAATRGRRVTPKLKLSTRERMDLDLAEELLKGCYETYHQTPTGLSPEIVYWRPFDVSKKAPLSFIKKTPFESGRSESEDVSPSTLFPFDMVLKHHQLGASQLFKSLSQTYSRHGSSIDFDRRSGNSSTTEQDFEIHQMDGHNLLRPETIESVFILYRITGKEVYRDMGWTMFQAFEKYTRVETGGYTSLSDVRQVPPPPRDKMESFFLGETLKYFYLLFSNDSLIPLDKYVFNTEAHPLPRFTINDPVLKEKLVWL